MNARRGEVFYIKKNTLGTVGSEQGDGRPYLVVSPDVLAASGRGAVCVPLTTQPKRRIPQHCEVICKYETSTVLCEQPRYIDESKFGDYCCTLTDAEMARVDKCLLAAVGVSPESFAESGVADELAKAKAKIKELSDQLTARTLGTAATNSEKDAEIEALKKEVERLKIQAEAYINIIKS